MDSFFALIEILHTLRELACSPYALAEIDLRLMSFWFNPTNA